VNASVNNTTTTIFQVFFLAYNINVAASRMGVAELCHQLQLIVKKTKLSQYLPLILQQKNLIHFTLLTRWRFIVVEILHGRGQSRKCVPGYSHRGLQWVVAVLVVDINSSKRRYTFWTILTRWNALALKCMCPMGGARFK